MAESEKRSGSEELERNVTINVGDTSTLKKRFSSLNIFAVCVTLMATWEATGAVFAGGLIAGGLVALLYGYIFAVFGTLMTCLSLAELASLCPTSGGQNEWTAILAPPWLAPFLSWVTGWITTLGWLALTGSAAFLGGLQIQGLIILSHPDYSPERWLGTVIYYAILIFALLINTVGIKIMPLVENMILLFHVLTFLAVLIPLTVLAPHKTAEYVFATFENNSGWNSDGIAWLLGLLSATYVLVGYDGACHLSEEMHQPAVILPRIMIGTILLNGTLGLGMLFALLFCIGDVESVLGSSTGFPIIQIFYNTTGSVTATCALMTPFIVVAVTSTFGLLASSSRTLWAFARDRGLPYSDRLARLSDRSMLPVSSLFMSVFFLMLLGLINIGSTTAFNAVVSLSVVGLYTSYLIPITLHAFRRIAGPPVSYGPFHLGKYGLFVNTLSVVYTTVVVIFLFFPPYQPVTAQNMNYASVVFGFVVLFSIAWWFFRGRNVYTGPITVRRH